jgi:SAM-dependent methyltransferase
MLRGRARGARAGRRAPLKRFQVTTGIVGGMSHPGPSARPDDAGRPPVGAPVPSQAPHPRVVETAVEDASLGARMYHRASVENKNTILRLMPPLPGAVLLDVGCDDGLDTARIAGHLGAARAIGLELADGAVERARANGIDVRHVDITGPWPLEEGSVDVVHSNQVIEHLAETDHFMREIRRVLRPGGYAIVSTNNLASWHNLFTLILGWQPLPCHVSDEHVVGNPLALEEVRYGERIHRHLRIFTGRGLAALARAHGLEVELSVGSGYYPLAGGPARLMARIDGRHAAYLVQRYR